MKLTQEYRADLSAAGKALDSAALDGKRVLVTGAAGGIGSCVVDLLLQVASDAGITIAVTAAGRDVEALERRFACWESGWTAVRYDAQDDCPVDGLYDFIIHCAANAHPIAYATQPVETMVTMVKGTQKVLDAARAVQGCRVLLVSSSEVYGQKDDAMPFGEDQYGYVDILNPRACYPVAKRAAETLCAAYQDEYAVDFAIVRPGHIYGPTSSSADSRAHAQFARMSASGQDVVLKSAGLQLRSYCYVVDCAAAMLFVMLKGQSGQAYNISNAQSVVTIRELAQCFAQAGGVQVSFGDLSELEQKGGSLMSNSSLVSDKLEALGWRALFDASTGALHTVNMLKANA